MWKTSSVLLLLVVAVSWGQLESDTVEWPSFTNSSTADTQISNNKENGPISTAVVPANLRTANQTTVNELSVVITTSTKNLVQDPMLSELCKKCACQNEMPFLVNCTSKGMNSAPLFPDWPNNEVLNSSIEAQFDENQFTEITQFPELPLVKLSYRGNVIQMIQKSAFKFLKNLEYLDLSENQLTHESLNGDVFEGKFNEIDYEPIPLKTLKLGYNMIHSIDKDAFNHLATHLEILELNNNPLNVIDHQTAMAITTLRKLKVLNLAETKLESIPEGLFHALRALQTLFLNGNHFVVVPKELQRAINLQYLNLNANPIKAFEAESFQGLTSLKELNISAMPSLEKIGKNTFTPLGSMIHLWCSFNPSLKKFHSGAFNNMAEDDGTLKLQQFHFRGNGVGSLSKTLLPWDHLQVVDISDNSFTCDCRVGWMVTELLPSLAKKEPEMTQTVTCSGPLDYKDKALLDLSTDSNIIGNCPKPLFDSDDVENVTGYPYLPGGRRPMAMTTSFNVGLMVISLFGIALVIGGIACMGLLAVRKSHLRQIYDSTSGQIVHYVRTPGGTGGKLEDEQAIVSREYNQYDEEP